MNNPGSGCLGFYAKKLPQMKYVPITMLAVSVFAVASTPAGGEDAEGVAFFEKHVRPLLVEHCYECHSAIATKSPVPKKLTASGI